jgi:hypothetical protein
MRKYFRKREQVGNIPEYSKPNMNAIKQAAVIKAVFCFLSFHRKNPVINSGCPAVGRRHK